MTDSFSCPQCGRASSTPVETACPACSAPTIVGAPKLDATLAQSPDSLLAGLSHSERSEDLRGELLGKRLDIYEIERFLGRGGMAWVFLARHANLGRPCALKILCPELQGRKSDSLDMFISEARAAASLVHPHVVTVHNIGNDEGRHFIELEYVAGGSLEGLIADGMNALQAAQLMSQACSALAQAHETGLVHRDFKPANIMVRRDGFAKLADFGLAKRIADTNAGPLSGTPFFMAPELFHRDAASKASDVYAVGVSLYQLVTGTYPFHHDKFSELARLHVEGEAPDVRRERPELSDELAALIRGCLEKDPGKRPEDGRELQERLESIYRSLRDLKSLAAAALNGLDLTWEFDGERVHAVVRLEDGRRQQVRLEETRCELWDTPLIRVFSICAPVCDDYLRRALELNALMPHGALAIQDVDGRPHYVIVNSYPRATCDPEELRHSVQDVAFWADRVEHALTGEDRH